MSIYLCDIFSCPINFVDVVQYCRQMIMQYKSFCLLQFVIKSDKIYVNQIYIRGFSFKPEHEQIFVGTLRSFKAAKRSKYLMYFKLR